MWDFLVNLPMEDVEADLKRRQQELLNEKVTKAEKFQAAVML